MRHFLAATALLALSAPAWADIQFYDSNQAGGTSNVLFNGVNDLTGPGPLLRGHIQGTSRQVDVTSNENLKVNNGNGGQAKIQATDGAFTLANIFLTTPPGGTFTKIIFALQAVNVFRGQTPDANFTISVTEGNGTINNQSYNLTQSNNFFTVIAVNGRDIRNINLVATTGSFEQLSQIRIGGLAGAVPSIPEPTSVILLGSIIGVVLVTHRKRCASAAAK